LLSRLLEEATGGGLLSVFAHAPKAISFFAFLKVNKNGGPADTTSGYGQPGKLVLNLYEIP
jgi:hypothetical protein